MRLVTDDGIFLTGDPVDLVAQLGARTRVLVGVATGGERASMLMQLECDRIVRYQFEIGSLFATFAAGRLLEDLEDEGLILICR
ncbi:hypothetical protein [Armatimonas sp.]|uniref:hypothetical protein n=1 Tax=Armatimonas sp. TaxID=1872638 RepID=UPI0037518F7D